jgi:hypothetical protein
MNSSEIIINIRENYKDCDERLEKLYRKEFDSYSPTKLKEVWETIQENHSYAKAPELGNIFKYMFMVGIARTKETGLFYHRCTRLIKKLDRYDNPEKDVDDDPIYEECNTKYSTKSKFCPVCNSNSLFKDREKYKKDSPVFNTIEVTKCNKLPSDIRVLNEMCSVCIKYHKNEMIQGSKCNAWGTHDKYKQANKNCKDCDCYDCCQEIAMNGHQKATFNINKSINKV